MHKTPQIITLPKISDLRGNLSFMEEMNHIPFKIERSYWIYGVPGGEERGGHAFKNVNEFVIPISGGFEVDMNIGDENKHYHLNQSNQGLLIPPMNWRKFTNFLSNSICLVVSDTKFDDSEYVRDFTEYVSLFQNL